VRQIQTKNKRRKAGGYYLTPEELRLALEEAYPTAIDKASLEVEEGRYEPEELAQKVNQESIINQSLALIVLPKQ